MKLGVLLPTFRERAQDAFDAADAAHDAGLDGVFAFDHLWPLGAPTRPALAPFPVLAAVAARHALVVGPLVARVGLASTAHLVAQFATLGELAPGRVIAALGTGDHLSEAENRAYGLPYATATERRGELASALEALTTSFEVWCGGGSVLTNQVARHHGVVLNLWGASSATVRDEAAAGPVSWAGRLGEDAGATLDAMEEAGATWAVSSEPSKIAAMKEWRRARGTHYGL